MDRVLGPVALFKAQGRLLHALMLRDIKTRLGSNGFGFLAIGVGWPLSHILIVLGINTLMGRAAPYGESSAVWFATGLVPFMAFQYMSRFIMLGVVLNRPLLALPIVKVTDILISRAIIEMLNAGLVVLIISAIFWVQGIDFIPLDIVQASLAMLSMMALGFGFGIVNAVIAAAFPFWVTGYALLTVVLWFSSGVVFVPDGLPEVARVPLSYLPTLQGVEWMRSSYYEGFGATILDRPYLISCAVVSLFVGLALERLVRGRLLQ